MLGWLWVSLACAMRMVMVSSSLHAYYGQLRDSDPSNQRPLNSGVWSIFVSAGKIA
jgi:hypothetical protein